MNKDVIYIEPEDDITDIINRIAGAKEKVVALVPPKNLGILRSAVNTKLIAKTAKKHGKVAVFITTDQSLMKLSMAAGIPVAKSLQSRPVVPTEADLAKKPKKDDVIEEESAPEDAEGGSEAVSVRAGTDGANAKKGAKTGSSEAARAKKSEMKLNSADIDEDGEKDAKKGDKKPKKGSKIPSLDKYRKRIIFGGVAGVALIIFLIWALVFAPSAKIVVAMHTTANAFNENVTFTTTEKDAKPKEGLLYLEKQEEKNTASVEFQATGQKNVGEHASGSLEVKVAIPEDGGSISIPSGTTFTYNGLAYTSVNDAAVSWDGDSIKQCENATATSISANGCIKSATIRISANEAGEKYNVGASASGWHSSVASVYSAANGSPISGGTDKTVIIVQQSDIDSAKEKLSNDSKIDKDALAKQFAKDYLTIESSYKEETSDAVATPAAGEEVGNGVTPKLSMTTTVSMYGVKKSDVDKFIKEKAGGDLASDQKIYSTGEPFFERFSENSGNYSAKLKTTIQVGPKVTEEEVLEKAKGKKIGEVQSLIKSINGVSSVKVEKSFFWVSSVPSDENKVSVELKVEE